RLFFGQEAAHTFRIVERVQSKDVRLACAGDAGGVAARAGRPRQRHLPGAGRRQFAAPENPGWRSLPTGVVERWKIAGDHGDRQEEVPLRSTWSWPGQAFGMAGRGGFIRGRPHCNNPGLLAEENAAGSGYRQFPFPFGLDAPASRSKTATRLNAKLKPESR